MRHWSERERAMITHSSTGVKVHSGELDGNGSEHERGGASRLIW
jgi:hypothetical protein